MHVLTLGRSGFAAGGAVEDALADQAVEPLDGDAAPVDADGEDDRPGADLVAAVEPDRALVRVDGAAAASDQPISAPRRFACRSARLASSSPEMPLGKPR